MATDELSAEEIKELRRTASVDLAVMSTWSRQRADRNNEVYPTMPRTPLILPAVSLSSEYLVMGHLLRRNILTYKAPPNNAGYDLLCIHPDPTKSEMHIRIQVKSRYQTDCDWKVPVREETFNSFDFLAVVFLNVGYFYNERVDDSGAQEPELFFLPHNVARNLYKTVKSGFNRVDLNKLSDDEREWYGGINGIEIIAEALKVPYPDRPQLEA
jgi:hypothetical protein